MGKKIYVDFDGTLFEDPQNDYPAIGEPMEEAIDDLKYEIEQGAEAWLYTLRSGKDLEAAIAKCKSVGIKLKGYVKNKPHYDEIWEDRAKKNCATK